MSEAIEAPEIKQGFKPKYRARFRQGRIEAGWSGRALAFEIGITAQAISQFELGKEAISLDNFLLACTKLNLSVYWVLKHRGEMFEEGGPTPTSGRVRKKPAKRSPAK
jgi:transcriptional regulator with XRE-family HTH domain